MAHPSIDLSKDKSKPHVRGYKEEGTTTTPFDMCVLNDIDRFHSVGDVIDHLPGLASKAAYLKQYLRDKLEHKESSTNMAKICRDPQLEMGP